MAAAAACHLFACRVFAMRREKESLGGGSNYFCRRGDGLRMKEARCLRRKLGCCRRRFSSCCFKGIRVFSYVIEEKAIIFLWCWGNLVENFDFGTSHR